MTQHPIWHRGIKHPQPIVGFNSTTRGASATTGAVWPATASSGGPRTSAWPYTGAPWMMARARTTGTHSRPESRMMPTVPPCSAAPSEPSPETITAPVPTWAVPTIKVPTIAPAAPKHRLSVEHIAEVVGREFNGSVWQTRPGSLCRRGNDKSAEYQNNSRARRYAGHGFLLYTHKTARF